MRGPDDGEVSAVKRRDVRFAEPLGGRDDGCVDRSEREVGVRFDELRHPLEVRGSRRLEAEPAARRCSQQGRLPARPERLPNEVGGLGEHKCGNDERACLALEQLSAGGVVRIVADSRSDERSGVYEESY